MAIKVTTHRPELSVPLNRLEESRALAAKISLFPRPAVIVDTSGPSLWKVLHTRALKNEGKDDSLWLEDFYRQLPCGDCKRHWKELISKTPPDFNHYFVWTVYVHDSVNERLGKPVVGVRNAEKIWATSI